MVSYYSKTWIWSSSEKKKLKGFHRQKTFKEPSLDYNPTKKSSQDRKSSKDRRPSKSFLVGTKCFKYPQNGTSIAI